MKTIGSPVVAAACSLILAVACADVHAQSAGSSISFLGLAAGQGPCAPFSGPRAQRSQAEASFFDYGAASVDCFVVMVRLDNAESFVCAGRAVPGLDGQPGVVVVPEVMVTPVTAQDFENVRSAVVRRDPRSGRMVTTQLTLIGGDLSGAKFGFLDSVAVRP